MVKTQPKSTKSPKSARRPKDSKEVRADTHKWNNRIVGYADVDPKEIVKNDANWREHPVMQQQKMEGILDRLGWLSTLMVNKTTGKLVDGHMRLDLALKEKEPTVPVCYIELSEAEEREALATYDIVGTLAQQNRRKLKNLEALNSEGIADLQSQSDENSSGVADLLKNASTIQGVVDRAIKKKHDRDDKTAKTLQEEVSVESTSDELPGLMELKDSRLNWEYGQNDYDIPSIDIQNCVFCPEPIVTWTTPDSSPQSPHYLTVMGNGNLHGLPFMASVLCGHTDDPTLDTTWYDQWSYTKKLLNRNFMACITPEFSVGHEFSKAERVWNTFRNRYIGAYWVAAGLKVIPSVSHLEVASDVNLIYCGVPVNVPCISVQVHAHYEKETTEEKMDRFANSFKSILKQLAPQSIIVYGDSHREEYIDFAGLRGHKTLSIISIEDYATQRFQHLTERSKG